MGRETGPEDEDEERAGPARNMQCGEVSSAVSQELDTTLRTVSAQNKILARIDPLVQRREAPRPNYLFWLWLILSYLGSLSTVLSVTWPLSVAACIIGLVIVYYLTVDYYYHEREEIAFLGKVSVALDKKGSSLTVNPTNPLHRRSYGLYIFLTIITLGIFGIYWAYVIFSDPNKHFDAHEVWESELERIIEKDLA